MGRSTGWTCQRQANRIKCGHRNLARAKKCAACGKPRPVKRKPKHMAALDLDYQGFVELNGGEFCGICKAKPSGRRLDRDHEHRGAGRPRGLLCRKCNRQLRGWATLEWLRGAVVYLERSMSRDEHRD